MLPETVALKVLFCFVLESLNLAWEFEPSLRRVCVDGSQDYFHNH